MASCSDTPNAIRDFVKNIERTHELEIGTTPEESLPGRACKKNPGHSQFIQIKNLTVNHLPHEWHKHLMLEYIKARSRLTVRIRNRIVSGGRPQSLLLPGMKPGANTVSYGTGYVRLKPEVVDPSLLSPEIRMMEMYRIGIFTAAHVLFDDVEADQAQVQFYFDEEDATSVVTISKCHVSCNNIDGDWCRFEFVIDSKELYDRIRSDWEKAEELRKQMEQQALEDEEPFPYWFTVSHPHGFSQHVSFGNKMEKIPVNRDDPFSPYYLQYNIPTCPGSSGAPIHGVKAPFFPIEYRPHHGVDTLSGLNRSGYDWF